MYTLRFFCRTDVHVLTSFDCGSVEGVEAIRAAYLDFIPAHIPCGIQTLSDPSVSFDILLTPLAAGSVILLNSQTLAAERVRWMRHMIIMSAGYTVNIIFYLHEFFSQVVEAVMWKRIRAMNMPILSLRGSRFCV